jgi:hypothetical protein
VHEAVDEDDKVVLEVSGWKEGHNLLEGGNGLVADAFGVDADQQLQGRQKAGNVLGAANEVNKSDKFFRKSDKNFVVIVDRLWEKSENEQIGGEEESTYLAGTG